MNLREVGEDQLLQRIAPHLPLNRFVLSGAGDDCAVTEFPGSNELLVLKTDCIVQGIHFASTAKAIDVGWKAMARPLSDFAAISGVPQFALITFIAPEETTLRWTTDVYRGLEKAARAFDVAIVGGETSGTTGPITISVSIVGRAEKGRWVSRNGGKAGDEIFVSGRLGGSIRGKHLRFVPRLVESRWLTSHFSIHAMMDLSDGLGADLPRLARASNVGFEVDETAIARTRGCTIQQAISDGEDYELLFAVPAKVSASLTSAWAKKFPEVPLTRIGRFIRESKSRNEEWSGYVHFK